MGTRDRLAQNLPGWLVDHLKEGFGAFAVDCYRQPTNKTEARVYNDLLGSGHTVLKKGWPDFLVLTSNDDLFVVEVKARGDEVRPQQRVVLEALARKGIDTYIWWDDLGCLEIVGESRHPSTHMSEWKSRLDLDDLEPVTWIPEIGIE